MKKLLLIFIALFTQHPLFAQGVGINTTTPDPSAALDVQSQNKGILIPRVNLTSNSDNTTIQSPKRGLLVFNTNANLNAGIGFYYNDGANSAFPYWLNLSKQFELPIGKTVTTNTVGLDIANYGALSSSTAIRGHHAGSGIGVRASSVSGLGLDVSGGLKIAGNGQSPGVGKVLTSDASGNATWEESGVPKVAFRAGGVKGGGSEKMARSIETKVPFASEEYDLGNNYTNADSSPHSTFLAPFNGIYSFDSRVSWSTLGDVVTLLILKRIRAGVTSEIATDALRSLEGGRNHISTEIPLQQGDQVFVTFSYGGLDSPDFILLNLQSHSCHFTGKLLIKQ